MIKSYIIEHNYFLTSWNWLYLQFQLDEKWTSRRLPWTFFQRAAQKHPWGLNDLSTRSCAVYVKLKCIVHGYYGMLCGDQTLARLAVKSTHSNNSPIFCRNSSTCGLFRTYTWNADTPFTATEQTYTQIHSGCAFYKHIGEGSRVASL